MLEPHWRAPAAGSELANSPGLFTLQKHRRIRGGRPAALRLCDLQRCGEWARSTPAVRQCQQRSEGLKVDEAMEETAPRERLVERERLELNGWRRRYQELNKVGKQYQDKRLLDLAQEARQGAEELAHVVTDRSGHQAGERRIF
jgi:hypothetical protein